MTVPRLSFRERFRHFHNVIGPASAWVFGVLVMLWLAAAVYLLVTGGPWEKALVKKLARGTELSWQQYRQWGVGWGMVGLTCLLGGCLATVHWWGAPGLAVLSDLPRPRPAKQAL